MSDHPDEIHTSAPVASGNDVLVPSTSIEVTGLTHLKNTNGDGTASQADNNHNAEPSETTQKLSGTAIALLMTPLCLTVILSALDLTILTPAVPAIVRDFNSSSGYVWIGSAFILASTAITPVWGSVADIWGRKPILLLALSFFLGGSLLCALAPRMDVLIAGRAVQGVGASGMGTMVNVIICDTFSLRDRSLYLAITSVVWAVGSAVGPVIGGSFTTRLDWRWCFWINLPIGAVVFFVLFFYLNIPSPHTPVLAGLKAIDWTGSLLIVGAALMILLGLEFGNVTYPWSSPTVICLITFGALVIGIFILNEWKLAINPVMPLRLFTNRSTVAAYAVFACTFYILVGLSYYLPLYSQSVLGADALQSGLHLVPLIVSTSLAAAGTGIFIQQTGVYRPLMYVAQTLLALGAGLFINLHYGESITKLVLFEIITGIGIGMNIDPPLLAAQAAATELDTAAINATMTFLRSIATAIAVVLGGVIFQNRMSSSNDDLAVHVGVQVARNFSGDLALANIELIRTLPGDEQDVVRRGYYEALRSVWIMCVVVAGISLLTSFFVRAHHLSAETKTVVLGVDRARAKNEQTNEAAQPGSVQLAELQTREIG